MHIIPTIIDTTSQPQLPNPDGPYGALSSAREMPKLTLRFDVQADDQGKAVAVAVKPILGRKLLGEKKGDGCRRSVLDQDGLIPCFAWGPILFCHTLFALRPYDVLGQRHRGYVRRFAERLGPQTRERAVAMVQNSCHF